MISTDKKVEAKNLYKAVPGGRFELPTLGL